MNGVLEEATYGKTRLTDMVIFHLSIRYLEPERLRQRGF